VDKRLLDEDAIMQICFVTDDLEKSLAWFSDLTGKTPSHIGSAAGHDEARATYRGKPAEVSCRLAIFKFANIDVEFLEPGPEKSAWRDLLEEKGPGVHHIAFKTRNMTERGKYLTGKGLAELQKAEFLGSNGRYAYYDTTGGLGIQLELLEFNDDMDPQV
jgi:catechol 2,3-dioxygenase-like lactoylglutathione lyase family enzyme